MSNQVNNIPIRQDEMLLYIYQNGIENVEMTPRQIGHNDHIYQRVWKLEVKGLINAKRIKGFPTKYSLTKLGEEYVEKNLLNF